MSCFIGLIMIAGIALNPCQISEMHQKVTEATRRTPVQYSCWVGFNSGDAWSGQHGVTLKGKCEDIVEEINKLKETQE